MIDLNSVAVGPCVSRGSQRENDRMSRSMIVLVLLLLGSILFTATRRPPSDGTTDGLRASLSDELSATQSDEFLSELDAVSARSSPTNDPAQFASEASEDASQNSMVSSQTDGLFPVHIRRPAAAPMIELKGTDPLGRTAKVACSTCHSARVPDLTNTADKLDTFHQGFEFAHGKLTCYACHHSEKPDSLRLADGQALPYPDVMTMCSQCHSPQAIAFEHGAHGGMNGFWDRSRGPQWKNNCIDCHDPHVPKYPHMVVRFKPHDRFLQPAGEDADHE